VAQGIQEWCNVEEDEATYPETLQHSGKWGDAKGDGATSRETVQGTVRRRKVAGDRLDPGGLHQFAPISRGGAIERAALA
jgi:hypothetical protein